jgi:hypothetical protein
MLAWAGRGKQSERIARTSEKMISKSSFGKFINARLWSNSRIA